MKVIKAACLGAGNRGIIYSEFAITNPEMLELVAVIDPNELHRTELARRHGIFPDMQFASVEEFVAKRPDCDIVINATIDKIHYSTTMPLLKAGYNVLLEKPITAKSEELIDLRDTAKKYGCGLFICHLLRYTPFSKSIKQHIINGDIGKITSIKASEYVNMSLFIEAFVVGKWRSEAECGSPFLLAKSCHDMDFICWLNNSTAPEKVASFGDRRVFIPENAPEGHTDTCHTCPHEKTCKYSLTNIFDGLSGEWKRIIHDINKPVSEVTQEDINNQLRHSSYGRCAYERKDLVDRQTVIIKFENGSIGTFDLIGGVAKGDRYLHIVGEDGEIIGNHSDNAYTLRKYDFKKKQYTEERIDVSEEIVGGHMGGELGIMTDICRYLSGEEASISMTSIEDSMNGHLCVYAAEKSRKTDTVVRL